MFTTQRSPLCEEDMIAAVEILDPIETLATSLAEIEAKAWLHDKRMTAILIGAARLALRETMETSQDETAYQGTIRPNE